ncbi:MAG: hypothetical protein H7A23_17675 [Leptospiraceae bacterium]|nr:hypothetical protein [Leptospiraceae bacterium]MCP5496380.1 hypothetical protein [Leptospiraceae bacterium]
MNTSIKQPLSNLQLELLKTFSHQLSENDLYELKKMLASFFAKRLIQQADKVWDEKNWTDQHVDTLLNTKLRKVNKPK